jgi:crotonobetaine/carnitine-CoA ligase
MAHDRAATFAELWDRTVDAHGARLFLRFEAPDRSVTEWTYAAFDELTARVACTLRAAGVGPAAGVHLALTNSPTFVAAWIAAIRLGSFIVPSDPMATTAELTDHITRTRPAVGLCAADRSATYRDAFEAGPTVFEVDETDTELAELAASAPSLLAPVADPHARAAVMFTSGTTGRPKGVVITQANYAFAGTTMADAAELTSTDRQLVVLPLFHANAQYYSFASAIAVGASVALMHIFSASGFVGQAARHEATHASLFAGPMRMILARGGPADSAGPALRLRHCWFAQNLAADQYAQLSDWLGCRPRQLYGMTETIPAVLNDRVDDPRPDTMGDVTRGCAVDLVDGTGGSCRPGEVGEIVVGGRRGIELFAEYLDDPATTDASFLDGWFRTGDRAWRDDDGRFHFDGRRADVLKVAGENVSVVEVESALTEHPAVLDAVVVGAPDPVRDEVPVAFVVPAASPGVGILDDPDELAAFVAELTAWAESRLGKAKRPHRYEIVADLPRTSVGKIRKFLLTDAARAGSSADPAHIPPNTTPTDHPAHDPTNHPEAPT